MRQRVQSDDDAKLRKALENMRYKACTSEDISFLRTLVTNSSRKNHSVCNNVFRNEAIITARNLHKDEINRVGAIRFAQETGQNLVDFCAEDVPFTGTSDDSKHGAKRVSVISDDMRKGLWSMPPSTTDKNIAGKLSLCVGMPIMIRTNYATELCMTRGQEGFVYGWQAKRGSTDQLMLDTLFVELKNPPTTVHFEGLPENVVPIVPTKNAITAALPNDDVLYINRTQVEVLINFAMTDFVSQGKTRLYNPIDLNNLFNHHAYYTALSRSSSASGTIILQGFDGRKVQGGCSGALRQEFQELEMLDEITRLTYDRKLPDSITGATRNQLIQSFRNWKGLQYVPSTVHRSIRWSPSKPFDETVVADSVSITDWTQVIKDVKLKDRDNEHPATLPPRNDLKRKVCDTNCGDADSMTEDLHRHKRIKFSAPQSNTYPSSSNVLVPAGMKWSNNSCAYDSIFAILYHVWLRDENRWSQCLSHAQLGNRVLQKLVDSFEDHRSNAAPLELARDSIRQDLHAIDPARMGYGRYASLERVLQEVFMINKLTFREFYECGNGHNFPLRDTFSCLSIMYHPYQSVNDHINHSHLSSTRSIPLCPTCSSIRVFRRSMVYSPPVLVVDVSINRSVEVNRCLRLRIGNDTCIYNLAGIVYFGRAHFTAAIIAPNNHFWYYDGLLNDGLMADHGSCDIIENIEKVNGRLACAAFYTLEHQ
ncbi:hypothetical protein CPB84DRAFT_1678858 [Gymnopilus junonius]|uniref:Uncharacterized protein n=2 Tax=Gymnopilus junonius TaxID=109634 RepID=A0A9P5NQU1_GYMJU|nr:hypothetical protein CPB84DRAFT_1678858 [Gymnopilus junonius]